jgi:hypothetical protein
MSAVCAARLYVVLMPADVDQSCIAGVVANCHILHMRHDYSAASHGFWV